MLDRNKLNRVKGILSARQGAEIPKHNGGAKFTKRNGYGLFIYSNDGATWFTDEQLKSPFRGNIAEFNDVNTSFQIPGVTPVTPNTAVENASEQVDKIEQHKADLQAEQIAAGTVLPEAQVTTSRSEKVSIAGIPLQEQQLELPSTIATPKEIQERVDSQGQNLVDEQKKEQRRKAFFGGASVAAKAAFQGVGTVLGAQQAATDSSLTKSANIGYNQTVEALQNAGPTGKTIGSAMQAAALVGDIIQGLGGGTDQMTNTDKWMDSSFFSWNVGMINGFGGKKANSFAADLDTISEIGSSYGGTVEDINSAANKAGKKYGLFSSSARRRANRQIADAKVKQNQMSDIADTASDQRLSVQSMGEQAGLAYSLMTDGGYNQKYTYAAKHGGLLEWSPVLTLEWEPQVKLNWDLPTFKDGGNIEIVEELEWIPELKSGGKTKQSDVPETEETTQKNVIPEGALHKNKHHMEHAEGLTKKGIPVIDEDGEQQAEIEHSEIIFTLEVTKKLEEYYDIFYSDESTNKEKEQAALDAGKLLVYQILENTEDRTGLIESCKKGGSLTLKKSTDDLIEEVLEWVPTIMIVEESKEESKKKSEKEMMKDAIKEVLVELLTK